MHHMEVRYGCSKWPHIIWLFTTLLHMCKLALEIQLQCSFLQTPRPLSNQISSLYLQGSLAHLLMRHGLQALGAWAHPSPSPAARPSCTSCPTGSVWSSQGGKTPWAVLTNSLEAALPLRSRIPGIQDSEPVLLLWFLHLEVSHISCSTWVIRKSYWQTGAVQRRATEMIKGVEELI